jgi:hypothetical protein
MKKHASMIVFLALIVVCVAGRLLSHAPNFTPVAAAALFAGFFFRSRIAAVLVPLLALLASDTLLGGYQLPIMLTVYCAFAAPVLLGAVLAKRMTALRLVGSAAAGSLLFFVSTNAAVWAWSGMYDLSAGGLAECYAAALPFLRYTFAGDLYWGVLFFGAYFLLKRASAVSISREAPA